jgi:hypothetical protein
MIVRRIEMGDHRQVRSPCLGAERRSRCTLHDQPSVVILSKRLCGIRAVPGRASWSIQFLAVGSAMTPWMIFSMIVWAAGEIIKVIKGTDT